MSRAIDEADLIEPQRLAECVIDDLINAARRPRDQRPRLTVREMRAAIEFETQLVCVAASNVAQGLPLTQDDVDRIWLARERILWIWEEGMR